MPKPNTANGLSHTQNWLAKYLGTQSVGNCPTCRQSLPADSRYRAYVRYGDGDDLIAYVPTYGTALAVLIGWADDETGGDFWSYFEADAWENLTAEQVAEFSADPVKFAGYVDALGAERSPIAAEMFEAIESTLLDTPMVGAVWIDSLHEPVMPSDYR